MKCRLCPRNCNVDRDINVGYCAVDNKVYLARAALHMWEEPCISGERGSGTIFFAGCNMRCVYCQNHTISNASVKKEVSIEHLSKIMLNLQDEGANNINLVTPSHYVLQIADAITSSRLNGLTIPIVYNTSSYENVETLKCLDGLIDVYLPDFKYFDDALSVKYSNAPNYREIAGAAIEEMTRQVGKNKFDERGMMIKGVIVRHLVLPTHIDDSKKIIKYLHDKYSDDIYISILNQYTPMKNLDNYPELMRTITEKEYDEVVDYAIKIGVENGFIQEGETKSESFIPAFDFEGLD